jgi:hypothetical protein
MLRRLLSASLLAGLLVGCAPSAQISGQATASVAVHRVNFYPDQNGLRWLYLKRGSPLSAPAYQLSSEGPTIFNGLEVRVFRLYGNGADRRWYRQISGRGVYLEGFSLPGVVVELSPPWEEDPPVADWKVGYTWSGSTHLTLISSGKTVQTLIVDYRYTVLEKRTVSVAGKSYRVWVVDREISSSNTAVFPPTSKELWFAPYVGNVKSADGLLLVAKNFQVRP